MESSCNKHSFFVPDSPEPSKAIIYNLIKKFRTTGSVLDTTRICVKGVLTEKMLDEIGHRLERSPKKPSRRVAKQVGVSQSSVMRYRTIEIGAISENELRRGAGHVFSLPDRPWTSFRTRIVNSVSTSLHNTNRKSAEGILRMW